LARDTRRTQCALEFQGINDRALVSPARDHIALDEFEAVVVGAHENIGINGFYRKSLDRIGRLTNQHLGLAKGDRDESLIGAIELDEDCATRG
jgi:hypothetical protein